MPFGLRNDAVLSVVCELRLRSEYVLKSTLYIRCVNVDIIPYENYFTEKTSCLKFDLVINLHLLLLR